MGSRGLARGLVGRLWLCCEQGVILLVQSSVLVENSARRHAVAATVVSAIALPANSLLVASGEGSSCRGGPHSFSAHLLLIKLRLRGGLTVMGQTRAEQTATGLQLSCFMPILYRVTTSDVSRFVIFLQPLSIRRYKSASQQSTRTHAYTCSVDICQFLYNAPPWQNEY